MTHLASWTGNTLPILANYSQWLSGFAMFGGVAAMYHRHNCHQPRCPWLVRHGQTHCRKHRS